MRKTLLLNNNYEIISFIDERKAIKLLLKNKVEILSTWHNRKIYYSQGSIDHPATLKMRYLVKLNATKLIYSKKLVLRRDQYRCTYCGHRYQPNKLTVDHIIPKSLGGKNSFLNCTTACLECNAKKSNKKLDEANMVLLKKPFVPFKYLCYYPSDIEWHSDWSFFV